MGLKEKALDNFELAQELWTQRKFDVAANRFYYAVFQAVCFYAKAKLGYSWSEKDGAEVLLPSGERIKGSAHKVIKGIVRTECKSKLDSFEDLLELRKIADYEQDSVSEHSLPRELIVDAQTLKDSFLRKGG